MTINDHWIEVLLSHGLHGTNVDDLVNRVAGVKKVTVVKCGIAYDLYGSWTQLKETIDAVENEAEALIQTGQRRIEEGHNNEFSRNVDPKKPPRKKQGNVDRDGKNAVAMDASGCHSNQDLNEADKKAPRRQRILRGECTENPDLVAVQQADPLAVQQEDLSRHNSLDEQCNEESNRKESCEEPDHPYVKTTAKRDRKLKKNPGSVMQQSTDQDPKLDEPYQIVDRSSSLVTYYSTEEKFEKIIFIPDLLHMYILTHCMSQIQSLTAKYCTSSLSNSEGDKGMISCKFTTKSESDLKAMTEKFKDLYSHLRTEEYEVPADVDWEKIELIAATNEDKNTSVVWDKNTRTCRMAGPGDSVKRLKNWIITTLATNLQMDIDGNDGACGSDTRLHQTGSYKKKDPAVSCGQFVMGGKCKEINNRLEFVTKAGLKVFVYQGDMVKQKTEAIVNAANDQLANAAGLARAISMAAGQDLEDECRTIISTKGKVQLGEAVYTKGGNLPHPIRYVIHVVGPNEYQFKNSAQNSNQAMKNAFYNCLRVANILKVSSISVPPISTGMF